MYGEFTWWQGVVEDRNDPLKLGRCRVRVLGYHTDRKTGYYSIPTNELPWATPMQPITSAAMNGIGTTPMGPVEGTWVFGFWRDGKSAQEPVIIGTVGGKMDKDDKKDPSRGFNDPDGIYPRDEFIGEADTNRLARGIGKPTVGSMNGENAQSLMNKRKSRRRGDPQTGKAVTNTGVPMGTAGIMWDYNANPPEGTIENTADGNLKVANADVGGIDGHVGDANHYKNDYWNEPNPRYGGIGDSDTEYLSSVTNTSQYPHNHVRMSEGGHVEEWDDSTSAERLHRYHRSGTFEEIQPDGTRVVKIVGRDYEIVANRKNVYIQGTCNITIDGDCRMLYRSDLVQEVVGDYHLHVGGEMRTKIMGNDTKEVTVDRKIVVNGEDDLFVAKNQIIHIGKDALEEITGHLDQTVKKNVTTTYGIGTTADTDSHGGAGYTPPGNYTINVSGKTFFTSIGTYTLTSEADMKINTDSNMHINVKLDSTQTITGSSEILVTEDQYENIGGDDTREVGGDFIEATGGTHASDAGGNMTKTAPNIYLN